MDISSSLSNLSQENIDSLKELPNDAIPNLELSFPRKTESKTNIILKESRENIHEKMHSSADKIQRNSEIEYINPDLFKDFYSDYMDFKGYVNDILNSGLHDFFRKPADTPSLNKRLEKETAIGKETQELKNKIKELSKENEILNNNCKTYWSIIQLLSKNIKDSVIQEQTIHQINNDILNERTSNTSQQANDNNKNENDLATSNERNFSIEGENREIF